MLIERRPPRRGRAANRSRVRGAWVRRLWARLPSLRTMRVPLAWLRRVRVPAIAAACGISLAALVWYGVPWTVRAVRGHPYFAVTRVEIDGNRRVSRDEVLLWAGLYDGVSVWEATPRAVRMRLLSHPWLQHVRVQRAFPNRVTITVRERHPAAIVQWDGLRYIDRQAHVLGPLRDDDSRDFPIITGLDRADHREFATVGMHRALQLLRWCERVNAFDAVSEIRVDRHRGVTVFPVRTAVPVVLGWGSWREKLARSARVFAAWDGQAGRLALVDVSFHDLVVVKLREESHAPAARAPKRGTRV